MPVHGFADIENTLLKNPVRRRIGYHQRPQLTTMLLALGLEILHVDVPLFVALYRYHSEPGHYSRGWIRSVGGYRNKTDIALGVSPVVMIGADSQEARILTLRTSIRL